MCSWLDGVVLEVDKVIEGGHGMHHRMLFSAQFGHVRTKNCSTQGGETPLTKQHGKPSWLALLAIRQFVSRC